MTRTPGTNESWSSTLLVARQEFRQTISTKAFWIGLLAFPLILSLAVAIPILLEGTRDTRRFSVVDESGWVLPAVEQRVYEEDLAGVVRRVRRLHRDDRREYDRLPSVLREAGAAWAAVDEATRPALLAALAGGGQPPPEVDLEQILRLARELRAWWRQAPAAELERHDLELTRLRFERVDMPPGGGDLAALNEAIREDRLFAYIVIGPDPVAGGEGSEYVSRNLTDRSLRDWFGEHVEAVVRQQRLAREGIDPEVAAWVERPVDFAERRVGDTGEVQEVATRDRVRQWAPAAFTYLLWMAVFSSAQMLLTSTIEEKTARIMEVLISSVSPTQLLAGKVTGVAVAGLIVVGSWALCLLLAVVGLSQVVGPAAQGLAQVAADPWFLLAFAVYFFLGYLLYAAYLVGLGSLCTSLKESQNLMWPAMVPLLVALFSMPHVSQDPNGMLARILSFVPPLTPFVMMTRSAGPPPLWEYGATTLLLIGSIWLAVHGAARLFRVGVLATGSRPSLRETLRWLWARNL